MWGLIILLLAIVLVILWINKYQNKYQSFQGNLFNFIVVSTLLFLVVSIGYVYLSGDFELKSFEDFLFFGKSYLSWLGNFFGNTKNIVGYTVKQDWGGNLTG